MPEERSSELGVDGEGTAPGHRPSSSTKLLDAIAQDIARDGFAVRTGKEMRAIMRARGLEAWPAFASTWDDLGIAKYMADGGYRRTTGGRGEPRMPRIQPRSGGEGPASKVSPPVRIAVSPDLRVDFRINWICSQKDVQRRLLRERSPMPSINPEVGPQSSFDHESRTPGGQLAMYMHRS